MTAIALLAVVLIALSAALVVRAATLPRLRAARSLDQISSYGFAAGDLPGAAAERPHILEVIGALIAGRIGRERQSALRRKLLAAGMYDTTLERHLGRCALAIVAVPLFAIWLVAVSKPSSMLAAVGITGGVLMGVLLPHALVTRRARLRLEEIDYEIPELVDLLVVGIEGGIGFNGAIRTASQRVGGALGDELRLMLQQQSLGASTTDALENLLGRCETPAVRSFVRTIVQGESLGVSIGQLMRNLAEEMRKRRRSRAEEQAQKTPIKILFPLVFMILPAMFIVLLTPAVGNIIKGFSNF